MDSEDVLGLIFVLIIIVVGLWMIYTMRWIFFIIGIAAVLFSVLAVSGFIIEITNHSKSSTKSTKSGTYNFTYTYQSGAHKSSTSHTHHKPNAHQTKNQPDKELEDANRLIWFTEKLYTQIVIEVNKTKSISLIKELEYDYEGLHSANLKSLLDNRKWVEYQDVVYSIIHDLERLHKLALKYQTEGYKKESNKAKQTEEERAYSILGVPVAATDDQIKKVYKIFVSIWHPDAKIVKDDRRIKEINWAYGFIGKKRKFK